MESGGSDSAPREPAKSARHYPSALLAIVPATLLAAVPFAAGVEGRLHPPTTCEGGICALSELYFYATPIVWIAGWIASSLLIFAFRRLKAAVTDRRS
jgi:hypothetical protein